MILNYKEIDFGVEKEVMLWYKGWRYVKDLIYNYQAYYDPLEEMERQVKEHLLVSMFDIRRCFLFLDIYRIKLLQKYTIIHSNKNDYLW